MALALATLRDLVEADLRDSANATWTVGEVDRAIAQALEELGRRWPRQADDTVVGLASRTVSLSTELAAGDYAALLKVVSVEYPAGEFPPVYVRFNQWGSNLTLHTVEDPAGVDDAVVRYETAYTLTGASSNVPEVWTEALALGAAGFAFEQLAGGRADTINVAGSGASARLAELARVRLDAFRLAIRRDNRLRTGQLFRPEQPYLTQDVVTGPGEQV